MGDLIAFIAITQAPRQRQQKQGARGPWLLFCRFRKENRIRNISNLLAVNFLPPGN